MSKKGTTKQKSMECAVKSGIGGLAFALTLLFPGAVLVNSGLIEWNNIKWISWLTACVGAMLGCIVFGKTQKGRGILLGIILSECTYAALLLVLSLGLPGGRLGWAQLFPVIIASAIGTIMGQLIIFNKTYTKEKKKQRRYTKSNHLKKFT